MPQRKTLHPLLHLLQVQDKEKAKYENDKHAGNAKSTTSGVDGDFASLTKDKISEGIK